MPSEFIANSDIDADENHFHRIYPSILESNSVQYYDSNSFKALNSSASTKDLSVIHLNIRSIRANCDTFLSFLSSLNHKFDVICFTESNLKDGEQAGEYFKNYKTFYSGRSNRQGGGVMVCVSENFDCEIIRQLTTILPFIEIVIIKVKFFNKQFFVLSV